MSRPYHQILMMLLAMIIIEAERTVMFSSQMCSSSFVSRMAPRVTMPKRPPDILSPEGRTKYFMCSEDTMENETKDNHISKKNSTTVFLKYNFMLSANDAGALIAAIPAGLAAVCCSSHNVLLSGQLIMATATFLVPLVTNIYWIIAVVLEIFVGVGMAIMLPSVFTVMADWENMDWKTTIVCLCLSGRPLGQLASFTLMSLTCDWEFFPGWIISHFIIGFAGLLWCALWLWFGHPRAPCAGCVNECSGCDDKNNSTRQYLCLQIWRVAIKEGAVWAIVFAWSATELMWMLIQTYSTVLNQIAYINEMWTSGGLLGTCVLTVITGVVADKIIDCNPESFRYLRKIFDSLGKVLVIILAIVTVRLHFACTDWFLVMSVVAMVTAIHCLQFAGCFANAIDIGVPCTAVAVSMVTFLSALSRLALWNGLFYSVPFDMRLLSFEPPLYAVSVILGCSIVIYMLFGAPDVTIYLPPDWTDINIGQGRGGPCLCCLPEQPKHKHIISIMDQAFSPNPRRTAQRVAEHTQSSAVYRNGSSYVIRGDVQRPRAGDPEPTYLDRLPKRQLSSEGDSTDLRSDDYCSPTTIRPDIPVVIVDEVDDDADWPPPLPPFPPISEQHSPFLPPRGERRSPRLQRADALDTSRSDGGRRSGRLLRNLAIDPGSDDNDDSTGGGSGQNTWLRAESRL